MTNPDMNKWANLRDSFAGLVSQLNPQLGQIAVDIARAVDKPNGGQTDFLSPKKEIWKQPANFLANGDATNPNPVFWATSVDESDFYYDKALRCWNDQKKPKDALTNLLQELAVWKESAEFVGPWIQRGGEYSTGVSFAVRPIG
jgi:hypothetical protein